MKFYYTLFFIILLSLAAEAQLRTNLAVGGSISTSSAFMDASSTIVWNSSTNVGKGLLFPRVNLTTFAAIANAGSGAPNNYPGRFDGMIVYNSTTGTASIGGTPVAPGFYYYSNKTTNVNGGTWTRLSDANDVATSPSGMAFPVSPAPKPGDIFYRTDLKNFYFYKDTEWVAVSSNPSGTSLPAAGVSKIGDVFYLTNADPALNVLKVFDGAAWVSIGVVSHDVTLTGDGNSVLLGLADDAVTTPKIADGSVTDSKIATGISKIKVGLANVDNTSDVNKPISAATQTALDLKATVTSVTNGLALKLDASQKAVASGVASLDAAGKVPTSQIPAISFSSTTVLATEAAMLGLGSALVGDVVVRTDVSKNFILSALPATTLSNWIELLTPAAPVQTVNGQIGTVSITKADVLLANADNTSDVNKPVSTAAQTALDLKENTANKSTAATLGTSDVLFPTQKAVKTYVDDALITGAPDATTSTKGKVQLAGDLAGTAALPVVAANAITTSKIADGSITDAKVATGISASKVGLANVDNTSDVNKPISTAAQSALDLKATVASVTNGLALKLDASEKAVADGVATLNALGKVPTSQIPAISFSSTTVLDTEAAMLGLGGALVGDVVVRTDVSKNFILSATPASTLSNWIELLTPAAPVQTVNGQIGTVSITKADVLLANVDNTSDVNKPVSTAAQTALDLKENTANKSTTITLGTSDVLFPTQKAVKTYVDDALIIGAPDATISAKGKVQLAGDLSGTAALPVVAANAITTSKIADGSITDAKVATGISASKVGLANVDNTSDVNKPISAATQTALDLKATVTALTNGLVLKLDASEKAIVNGIATLDALGKVPTSQIPAISFSTTTVLASEAAMLGLSSALKGDVVVRTDISKNFILSATPASTLSNWIELLTPAAPVQTVNGQIGTVSITKADVLLANVDNTSDVNKPVSTAAQTALDLKENTANKSTATTLGTSDVLFPTQKAVKTYVDDALITAAPDATTITKGKVQLAGDLSGTAALPLVAANAITSAKIADGTIVVSDLANDAVETAKIKDTNVTATKLAPDAVVTTKIKDQNVTATKLAGITTNGTSGQVLSSNADGTLVWANGMTNALTNSNILIGDGANLAKQVALTGDATLANTGAITIVTNAVTSAKIADGTILVSDLANDAVETAKIKDANVTASKLATDAVVTTKIKDQNVTVTKLAGITTNGTTGQVLSSNSDGTLVWANSLADVLNNGKILIGNASNLAKPVDLSGDATLTNAGIITIADNKVTTSKIIDDAVTTVKIADGNVTDAKIATGISKIKVGLGNVDNTADADKPISEATQTALDLKASVISVTNGLALKLDASQKAIVNGVATLDATGKVPTSQIPAISFSTTTVLASEAAMLGLSSALKGDVVVRTDISKNFILSATPASTLGNWIELLTPAAPVQTVNGQIGTVSITKADVLLANVDNTSDVNKPVSTAAQTAFNLKENTANKSTATTLGTSDVLFPTQKAVKTYVDNALITGAPDATTITKGKVQLAGDLSGTAALPVVAANAITSAKIADGTIVVSDLANDAVETAKIKDANVTSAKILDANVTANKLATDAVVTAKIKDQNVTATKLAGITTNGTSGQVLSSNADGSLAWANGLTDNLVNGQILLGNGSSKAAAVTPTGDVTINNAGVTAIGASKIVTGMIADANITSAKIADGTIVVADLANDAVETAKIKDANVTTAKIATDAVTSAKIADGTIVAADLNQMSATTGQALIWVNSTTKWAPTTISTTDELVKVTGGTAKALSATDFDGSGTDISIKSGAVTSTKIAGGGVTSMNILDGTIAMSDLADNAVETTKIKDANVTKAKLSATAGTTGQVLSTDGTSLSWATPTAISNGTVSGNTVRWTGAAWAESAALKNDGTDITTTGNLSVNGGTVNTTATTANLLNAVATTVNLAGASTTTKVGATTSGTTTIGYNLAVPNANISIGTPTVTHITVNGGDLTVAGDAEFDGNLWVDGTLSSPSDQRLKTNIETLTSVLAKIEQIRGVTYVFKDQQKYAAGPQVGVIAQELQKVFPELVTKGADGFLAVNYTQLTAVILQAVKEQQQEINLLKKQMETVFKKLNLK